jgi:hypothetical protein
MGIEGGICQDRYFACGVPSINVKPWIGFSDAETLRIQQRFVKRTPLLHHLRQNHICRRRQDAFYACKFATCQIVGEEINRRQRCRRRSAQVQGNSLLFR